MPTREEIATLKALSDQAERDYQTAVRTATVARVAVAESAKNAARARMKYNRAMGAMLADEGEDDGA